MTSFLQGSVRSAFSCAVSDVEASGRSDFVFLPCGHVFATKALKATVDVPRISTVLNCLSETPSHEHAQFACPVCAALTSTASVLPLAPQAEVQSLLAMADQKRKAASKARKAAKRLRAGAEASEQDSSAKRARGPDPAAPAVRVQLPPGVASIVADAARTTSAAAAKSKALGELLHTGRSAAEASMVSGAEKKSGFIRGGM